MPGAWIDDKEDNDNKQHLSAAEEPWVYDPAKSTPLLRLPPELRLQILVHVIGDALYEAFGSLHLLLEDKTLPLWRAPPSCLLSLFLINRVLHDEAETALWKNFPLVVHSHWRETSNLPAAIRPLLQLSTYAASNLLRLEIPIHLNADNLWGYNLPSYQNCGLFHLKRLAARFTGLLEVTFLIIVDDKDSMPIPTADRGEFELVRGLLEDVVVKFSAKMLMLAIEVETSRWIESFAEMDLDQGEYDDIFLEVRNLDFWTAAGMYRRRQKQRVSFSLTGDGDPRNFPRRRPSWNWFWK